MKFLEKPSAEIQKNLKCRYINYHPFLYIAPVKEELLHENPHIWLYHDVITDKQIAYIKNLSSEAVHFNFISHYIIPLV